MHWEINNAQIITPKSIIPSGGLLIQSDQISAVLKRAQAGQAEVQLDLDGLLVFPGMIDAHDHLLGTYLPKVGDNRPYLNWLPWDNDLKGSPTYAERQQLDAHHLYRLGGYRHLITGVTSVQDHIPHFVQEPFLDLTPVRILSDFCMAHSICSYSLAWGEGIEKEYELARERKWPFITHCSEGFDEESVRAVSVLAGKNALGPNTVLIHGIAFTDQDIELLARKKVNVVWCPNSNLYMFNATTNIKALLEAGVNVCLGTDSPMSGSVNMFDEFRTAKEFYRQEYGEELADDVLVDMVTVNPAKALYVQDQLGSLEAGKKADFFVMDGQAANPYRSLVEGSLKDIRLVVIDGKPAYGEPGFRSLFETLKVPVYEVTVDGQERIASHDIAGLMEEVRATVGFHKELEFLPV